MSDEPAGARRLLLIALLNTLTGDTGYLSGCTFNIYILYKKKIKNN